MQNIVFKKIERKKPITAYLLRFVTYENCQLSNPNLSIFVVLGQNPGQFFRKSREILKNPRKFWTNLEYEMKQNKI